MNSIPFPKPERDLRAELDASIQFHRAADDAAERATGAG
jgi:hypothetical protein